MPGLNQDSLCECGHHESAHHWGQQGGGYYEGPYLIYQCWSYCGCQKFTHPSTKRLSVEPPLTNPSLDRPQHRDRRGDRKVW